MPTEFSNVARLLIVLGLLIAGLGALLSLAGKLPWLGRLPGDILIRRDGFFLYIPLTSGLLLSVLVTFLWRVFGRR